ncbi:urea transporter [Algoriphagus aquimarinus]|uniref:Urea transporter n=1 Tax=Algoriphagus aquimarinus TaxID=237018 RepID=A0A1I1BJA2_9BACT|nr:urea transporter [Algoriphagus aquimarinus]SFB50455.1 urea transporter [Algoriphagus aquimarinus]
MDSFDFKTFGKVFLRGVAQIMLQENAITGALFVLGVFYSSWQMGIGLTIGTLVGTIVGYTFKGFRKEWEMGLYGFNGALVGTAVVLGYGFGFTALLITIAAAALSTYIMHYAINKGWKVFTFPFIVASWLFVTAIGSFIIEPAVTTPPVKPAKEINLLSKSSDLKEDDGYDEQVNYLDEWEDRLDDIEDLGDDEFLNSLHSYGQIIFQGSLVTGLLFLLGVYLNDPIAGVYGIIGSIIAILVAHILKLDNYSIFQGLLGFNAILCAIVFSGLRRRNGLAVALSCSLSVFIYIVMKDFGIPPYTFPFVLATWIVLVLQNIPISVKRKS